jgi:heptosyltransferase-2|tara:strand:- start:652 stop:1842 length:1191 start_codon:yes stop_codon:yes gene_type:complete
MGHKIKPTGYSGMGMKTCRYFKGDRPCNYYWIDRSWECSTCSHHFPFNEKILLIKLDSAGDVVRSTCIAEGLKKKYPDSQLTWLVAKESKTFIENNLFIDSIVLYNEENIRILQGRTFDIIINLDKDAKATSIIKLCNSDNKLGYGLHEDGHVIPLNSGSEYHYNICLDNWGQKQKNIKSYQKMIFDMAELKYDNEVPELYLDDNLSKNFKNTFFKKYKIQLDFNIILLNTGCGPTLPEKKWTYDGFKKLIHLLSKDKRNMIILTGAGNEIDRNSKLFKECNVSGNFIDTTNKYSLKEFIFLINLCDVIVTADSVALQIAIALKRRIITFFGPGPSKESDMFGFGKAFVREELECLMCHGKQAREDFECPYDKKCMTLIKADEVHLAITELLEDIK